MHFLFLVVITCNAFVYFQLPIPREISDRELLELLKSEDPAGFRIPMSLGEPHAELDKGTGIFLHFAG